MVENIVPSIDSGSGSGSVALAEQDEDSEHDSFEDGESTQENNEDGQERDSLLTARTRFLQRRQFLDHDHLPACLKVAALL